MRLAEDLINKMMTLHEDFKLRKFELRSIWMFYKCYNLSINILGIEDKDKKKKQRIWKNILYYTAKNDTYNVNRDMEKLLDYISQDIIIISEALSVIRQDSEKDGLNNSSLWRKGVLAVPDYAMEWN